MTESEKQSEGEMVVFGNGWRLVAILVAVLLAFGSGICFGTWRGSVRESILTAKYKLEIERTNSDLAIAQGTVAGLQESNRRMGDGLTTALIRARKATSYSDRARELYNGLKLAFKELGVDVE